MATVQDNIDVALEEEQKAEKEWRDYVDSLPPTPTDTQWNRQKLLEKKWKNAQAKRKKAEKPLRDLEKNLDTVRNSIKTLQEVAKTPESRSAAERELVKFRSEEEKLLNQIESFSTKTTTSVAPSRTTTPSPTTTRTTTTAAVSTPASTTPASMTVGRNRDLFSGARVAGSQTEDTTDDVVVPPPGVTKIDTDKTKKPALPKNWEAKFQQMFPNQAWLIELDRTKYPKLFKLIQRAMIDRMYETPEGLQRFDAELRNTDFYVELRNTDKVRQIKSLVGDLGFGSADNFNKFLATASNMDWEGETLQQEVYKEAFKKDDTGQYVNPTAVTRAKASNNYLGIANIGKAYFSQVANTTIENALTGGITKEDVERQQRELAKTKYGHLSNLIEQGFTLQELASPFQEQAANLLEKTVEDIDMSQANFEAAYNYGETGQKRLMTSGEWEIMLRSDAKYGWDKTNNAKAEARQLASSIAQAFGKVI